MDDDSLGFWIWVKVMMAVGEREMEIRGSFLAAIECGADQDE